MTEAIYAQIANRERELYSRFQKLVQPSDLQATAEAWEYWLWAMDKLIPYQIPVTLRPRQ